MSVKRWNNASTGEGSGIQQSSGIGNTTSQGIQQPSGIENTTVIGVCFCLCILATVC